MLKMTCPECGLLTELIDENYDPLWLRFKCPKFHKIDAELIVNPWRDK